VKKKDTGKSFSRGKRSTKLGEEREKKIRLDGKRRRKMTDRVQTSLNNHNEEERRVPRGKKEV